MHASFHLFTVTGPATLFLPMARFLCLLVATMFFTVGKPQNSVSSAQEPDVLQQLSSAAGPGSIPLSNSDGQVPDSKLQDVGDSAISFQDPSMPESVTTGDSLMSNSDLIASAPNSCPNPASRLRKRQNPIQWVWDRIQGTMKSPPPPALPSSPSFCPNSPNAFNQEGGSSAPNLGPEAATQDGQPIVAPSPRRKIIKNRPKKDPQETKQDAPEPMAVGPGGPSCPYDYPQKVCCRDKSTQLYPEWGAFLDDCWDCEHLSLTL